MDKEGNCNAYAFAVNYNELGQLSVEFAKEVLVVCD
jgi:hypothetical protein